MNLEIPSPEPGIYYVHLADSAWIQGDDQTRDHMIRADVVPIEPPPCTDPLVTSISPTSGGTAGPVTVRINGQCFDPEAAVCLTRQSYSDVCAATVTSDDDGRTLAATFDLAVAEPGEWTLVLTNPDSQSAAAPSPFTVESGGEVELWVEILGRDRIRVGRTATYVVRYGNAGEVDADHVYIIVGVPAALACDVNLPWSTIESGPWLGDSSDPSAIYATVVYMAFLPPGAEGEFDVHIRSNAVADSLTLYADITLDPSPYFQSLISGCPKDPLAFLGTQGKASSPVIRTTNWSLSEVEPDQYLCSAEPPAGYILIWDDYPDNTPAGPMLNHVVKSIGGGRYIDMTRNGIRVGEVSEVIHCSSGKPDHDLGYWGAWRTPWWDEDDARQVQQTAARIEALKEEGRIIDKYENELCKMQFSPLTPDGPARIETNCIGFIWFLNPEFKERADRGEKPWGFLKQEIQAIIRGEKWEKLGREPIRVSHGTTDESHCSEGHKRFPWSDAQKTFDSITSVSPEDKYGPSGWDAPGTLAEELQRWIPADRALDYRIDFWNKEDAPAATVDVVISDTLDADLDWSAFWFTEIGFLDWQVELEPTQYFNVNVEDVQIDLSEYYVGAPVVDLVVNVEGAFDADTGQIEWQFHALDPITRQSPEEPLAGFLPPITDSGWEIGWVAFSVSPKPGLASGTAITNQAFVQFDINPFNPAPPGGPFVNTVDAVPPSSVVQSPTGNQRCSSFQVTWAGTDDQNGSGLRSFDVYVDDLNDAQPVYLWQAGTVKASATFSGYPGHTYRFYTRARDNAGNIEAAPDAPSYDTEVTAGMYCVWLPLVLKGNP